MLKSKFSGASGKQFYDAADERDAAFIALFLCILLVAKSVCLQIVWYFNFKDLAPVFNAPTNVLYLLVPFTLRNRFSVYGRVLLSVLASIDVFYLGNIFGRESFFGVYNVLVLCATFVLFIKEEMRARIAIVLLTTGLYATQHFTDYKLIFGQNFIIPVPKYLPLLNAIFGLCGIAGILYYFSTRKDKAQSRLNDTEFRLQTLLNNLDGSAFSVDKDYCLITANQTFYAKIKQLGAGVIKLGDLLLHNNLDQNLRADLRVLFDIGLEGNTYATTYTYESLSFEVNIKPIFDVTETVSGVAVYVVDVTKRIALSKQLAESEGNIRAILENTNDFMFSLSTDLRLLSFNKRFEKGVLKLNGTTPLQNDLIIQHIPLSISTYWLDIFQQVFAGSKVRKEYTIPFYILPRNLVLEMQLAPITLPDGTISAITCIARNVTDNIMAERGLRNSEQRFRELAESINEVFWIAEEGIVTYVGPAYEQVWEENPEKLASKSKDFLKQVGAYPLFNANLGLPTGGSLYREFQLTISNPTSKIKHTKWIASRVYPIVEHSKIVRVIGFASDISEAKLREEELTEAKKRAETASTAKAGFLALMSHEIRTPLNGILGIAHLLMNDQPRADQESNLKTLVFSTEQVMGIINDVLDFNKIEADKIVLETKDFDLKFLLINSLQALKTIAFTNKNKVTLRLEKGLPKTIATDQMRLNQILTNLVANALKFTKEGEVTITAKLKSQVATDVIIEICVEDTGIGIAPDRLEGIFESYTQASDDTSRLYGGSGLGLAITRKLTDLLGGTVTVTSKLGKGSAFTFTLEAHQTSNVKLTEDFTALINSKEDFDSPKPNANQLLTNNIPESRIDDLASQPNAIADVPLGIKPPQPVYNLNGARVLVVEDNEINQVVVTRFLTKWNAKVDIANNGRIGYEMVQSKNYDIVLMDLLMPEMDGHMSTKAIRALEDPYFQKLPILALTATALPNMQADIKASGMNDYLTKPFQPPALYSKLCDHLNLESIPS